MCCPKKKFWTKQKTITPPLQVKWSVPNDNITYFKIFAMKGRQLQINFDIVFYHSTLSGRFMEFNATFNNISIISWWSVLLVEETGGPWENHLHVVSHYQTSNNERRSKSQRKWWYALIAQVVVNPTAIRSPPLLERNTEEWIYFEIGYNKYWCFYSPHLNAINLILILYITSYEDVFVYSILYIISDKQTKNGFPYMTYHWSSIRFKMVKNRIRIIY